MKRSPSTRVASFILIVLGVGFCCQLSRRAQNPDIVLITVDTLRADHLGCYGYEAAQTPNVDGLAKKGRIFLRAMTPLPRTTPALASLLSGLEPHHHGSREVAEAISSVGLLPELLRQHGYTTMGLTANSVSGPGQGLDRGFDQFRVEHNASAEEINLAALEMFRELPAGLAKFLWIHYFDPHAPYLPPASWAKGFEGAPCLELYRSYLEGDKKLGHIFSNYQQLGRNSLPSCTEMYDAEIAYTDFHIGRLLDGLSSSIDLERAFIVFTSDHGENLGEEGLFYEHGPSLHDASLKVPLIIVGPDVDPGEDHMVARLQDIMPTLLALLQVPRDLWPVVDGVDLSLRLKDSTRSAFGDELVAFAEGGSNLFAHDFRSVHSGWADGLHCLNEERFSLCRNGESPFRLYDHVNDPHLSSDLSTRYPEIKQRLLRLRKVWPPEQARQRALRTSQFKLVERPLLEGGYRRSLYYLKTDPEEKHDVASSYPEVAAELETALDRWTRELPMQRQVRRSSKEKQSLRSLGYIR